MSKIRIQNALISVTNKNLLEKLALNLEKLEINIFSTGGSAKFLKKYVDNVTEIENITNFPEIFDGRVKTLHPKIFGGILYRRSLKKDQKIAKQFDIKNIDLVVVNLYEFEKTMNHSSSLKKIVESIDIGGPSLIRAAAKNYNYTTVIVDTKDYNELINQLKTKGTTSLNFRRYLAKKAFELTHQYDR